MSHDRKYKVSVKSKFYDIILHPDLEDGGFWVDCPSLAGCASQGKTTEEALAMIKDAIEDILRYMRFLNPLKILAEGEGLEPPRAFAR